MTDDEMDAIIADWPGEWKIPVSVEEFSDTEAGPLPDAPIEQAQTQESDKEAARRNG